MRERRVGSLSLGVMLVVYGILFIIHMVAPALKYSIIFRIWPIIFMLLGAEILYDTLSSGEEVKFKYDFLAVIMVMIVAFFAMGMAGLDWMLVNHVKCITF